jgi:hypothetical protein
VDAPTDSAARRRALLRTLERALYDAIAESEELHRALYELQREGLQVRLSIACEPGAGLPSAPPAAPRRQSGREVASFRIDSDDLRFLRSIGIDPTRARRSRRRS